MWLTNPKTGRMEPTKVNVTPESLKKDYKILKENLPIQLGIDHLDMDASVLKKNKILQKMNLLNVGVLKDVKLENNKIRIADATITNPIIRELHDNGELNDFSIVSNMNVTPCPTGMADKVEEYSVINRVDFVGTGACKTCKVESPLGLASSSAYNAKAIIGDESMAIDPNVDPNVDPKAQDPKAEPTMAELMTVIKNMATHMTTSLKSIEGALKIKTVDPNAPAVPDPNAAPAAPAAGSDSGEEEEIEGQASKPDPEIEQLKKDVATFKATAAKAEAISIIKPFQEDGKILPVDIEKHIGMAMKAPEDYKEIMKNAKAVIDMTKHSKTLPGNAADSEDEDEYSDKDFDKDFEAAYGSKPNKD